MGMPAVEQVFGWLVALCSAAQSQQELTCSPDWFSERVQGVLTRTNREGDSILHFALQLYQAHELSYVKWAQELVSACPEMLHKDNEAFTSPFDRSERNFEMPGEMTTFLNSVAHVPEGNFLTIEQKASMANLRVSTTKRTAKACVLL